MRSDKERLRSPPAAHQQTCPVCTNVGHHSIACSASSHRRLARGGMVCGKLSLQQQTGVELSARPLNLPRSRKVVSFNFCEQAAASAFRCCARRCARRCKLGEGPHYKQCERVGRLLAVIQYRYDIFSGLHYLLPLQDCRGRCISLEVLQ